MEIFIAVLMGIGIFCGAITLAGGNVVYEVARTFGSIFKFLFWLGAFGFGMLVIAAVGIWAWRIVF